MARIEVLEDRRLNGSPCYHGWPTIARSSRGDLLCVTSAGRQKHTCPFGQIWLLRSSDEGETWSVPEVLANGPLDERDCGIFETSRGTLLVNWFNSVEWLNVVDRLEKGGSEPDLELDEISHWYKVRSALAARDYRRDLGTWMIRSTDGGATWSAPYDSVVSSAHGPCELEDGRLLHVGAERLDPQRTANGDVRGRTLVAVESTDDGLSWQRIGVVPWRPGDAEHLYLEPHAVAVGDRVVVQIRSHGSTEAERDLLQSESRDGGRSWVTPRSVGFFGFPTHLLRLRDGRLVTSYGHRRSPYGVQARLSTDGGEHWSEALVLSDDAVGTDFGYPSTVELEDASLLTVWYDKQRAGEAAFLRLARWRIAD